MPKMFNHSLPKLLVGAWLFFTVLQLTAAPSIYQYYILNPRIENDALSVISLADRNTIQAGATKLNLDRYQTGSIPAGLDLTSGMVISATGPFTLGSQVDATDLPVPGYFIGTKFIIPHFRNDHTYYILSPKADAQVTITIDGATTIVTAQQDQVLNYSAGSTNNISGLIQSDQPILVAHAANNSLQDVYPVPPVAKELWGIRSNTAIVGAMEDNTSVTVTGSSSATESFTLNAGGYRLLTIPSGTQGSGSAVHIVADKPIAAIQTADSDGAETTAFLDTPYLSTRYALPIDTQYVAVVCPQFTNVTLTNGTTTETQSCAGDGTQPGKAYFGSTTNGININAGAYIEADRPVYIYYEASITNDEHNITGGKDNYYILNLRFQNGPLSVMSLVDDNWITTGSSSLLLNQHEHGLIAGSELLPRTEIWGTGPFTLGSEVDGTDLPVPGNFAGTTFVIPHARDTHTYYLSSPYGEANVSLDIGGTVSIYTIAQDQVINIDAGSDTTTAGIIKSDRPILVSHQAGASGDAYPVPPAATELWGIRTGNVSMAAAEDNTTVVAYSSDTRTTTYTLNAGIRQSMNTGANTAQGQGAAVHLIADKPIAAYQLADSDGYDATAFLQQTYHGNRFGLPVDTQYVSIACPTPGTNVTLYESLKAPVTQTCAGIGEYPGKLYFGSEVNGVNISAGSYIDADEPVYAIYEASATNDEHNLLGYNTLEPARPLPPVIDAIPTTTYANPLVIKGRAVPGQTVKIYVNDEIQNVTTALPDGTFSYEAVLQDGNNEIHATTWDDIKESHPTPTSTVNYQNTLLRDINSTNNNLTIASNTVWTPGSTPEPYVITGTLTVTSDATLTLQPGVELQFKRGGQLTVNGTVSIQGTADNKVTFTSNDSNQNAGDWVGIVINSSMASNIINHADIRYAQYGVRFNAGSRGEIHNSTITLNYYGIYAAGDSAADKNPVPVVTGNNIYNNRNYNYYAYPFYDAENVVLDASNNWWGGTTGAYVFLKILDQGDASINPDAAWVSVDGIKGSLDGTVTKYLLHEPIKTTKTLPENAVVGVGGSVRDERTVTVLNGGNLTVESGVRFEMERGSKLRIDGEINIQGTADNKVTFTSNDSNQNAGDWVGIVINSSMASNIINHADIRYAQYGVRFNAGSRGEIHNSTITLNYYGIYAAGDSAVDKNPVPVVTGNNIYNNRNYNYYAYPFYDAENVVLDASNNWWGSRNTTTIYQKILDQDDSAIYPDAAWVKIGPFLDAENGNPIPGSILYGGPIKTVVTLPSGNYILEAGTRILPGGYLILTAGSTTLQYPPGAGIVVNGGGLVIIGTDTDPVVLTSIERAGPGEWEGITVEGYNPYININNAIIEYATNGLTFSNSGTVGSVTHSNIRNNDTGIRINAGSSPTISSANVITANDNYGIHIVGDGTVTTNPNPVITGNSIYDNGMRGAHREPNRDYHATSFGNPLNTILTATGNWWGTLDLFEISDRIFEYSDDPSASPQVNYSQYLDAIDGTEVQSNYLFGQVSDSSQLLTAGIYTVTNSLSVPEGETLTLPAGTILNFLPGTGINIKGALVSQGTISEPVIFTTTMEIPGSWNGLAFDVTSTGNVVENIVVEWAATGVNVIGAQLDIKNSVFRGVSVNGIYYQADSGGEITNNIIRNSTKTGYGIRLDSSSPAIQGNNIQYMDRGIYVSINSSPVINSSNDVTNNNYGIYIAGDNSANNNPNPIVTGNNIYDNSINDYYATAFGEPLTTVLTATGNWWGTVNVSGIANRILEYSDSPNYSPVVNYGDYLDAIDGNMVSGNYLYGRVNNTVTPLQANTKYIVISKLSIPANNDWTVPEGVQLSFTPNTGLTVDGNLFVNGLQGQEIIFTSAKFTLPLYDWDGIRLNIGATLSMNYAVVEYAQFGLYFDSASGFIANSLIHFNNIGIYIQGSTEPGLEISGNRIISNSNYGIWLYGNTVDGLYPQPVIIGNDIIDNRYEVTVDNYGDYSQTLIMTDNWWGTDSPAEGAQILQRSGSATIDFSNYKTSPLFGAEITGVSSISRTYISPANNDGIYDDTVLNVVLSASSDWQVDVINNSNQVLKTETGTGTSLFVVWDGKNADSIMQADGDYYFRIMVGGTRLLGRSGMQKIVIDNTPPVADIDNNQNDDVLNNIDTYSINGSASDTNFNEYVVEYAMGSAPTAGEWRRIENAKRAIVNGSELAKWVLRDADGYRTLIPAGDYSIKLTVSDKAGNIETDTILVKVDVLSIANVSYAPDLIRPVFGEESVVKFNISKPANIVMSILTEDTLQPVRKVTQECLSAGECTVSWDGKDYFGQFVQDEAYVFTLKATTPTDETNYNLNDLSGGGKGANGPRTYTRNYNIYKNEFFYVDLSLSTNSRVYYYIYRTNQNYPSFYVLKGVPYTSGWHMIYWDGRDNNNNILTGTINQYFAVPVNLKQNAIIVKGTKPTVTGTGTAPNIEVKSDPYFITHSYDQYTHFTYHLDQDADVMVTLLPPGVTDINDSRAIVLTSTEMQLANNPDGTPVDHTVEWTGYDVADPNNIQISEEGAYTFAIQATSVASGYSTLYRGVIQMRQ